MFNRWKDTLKPTNQQRDRWPSRKLFLISKEILKQTLELSDASLLLKTAQLTRISSVNIKEHKQRWNIHGGEISFKHSERSHTKEIEPVMHLSFIMKLHTTLRNWDSLKVPLTFTNFDFDYLQIQNKKEQKFTNISKVYKRVKNSNSGDLTEDWLFEVRPPIRMHKCLVLLMIC